LRNVLDLARLHVETLFTHDHDGRLLTVNEPAGAPAPRFFLARTLHGDVIRFRQDVDSALARELEATCREDQAPDITAPTASMQVKLEALLERAAPIHKRWSGPAYYFPDTFPDVPDAVRISGDNAHLLEQHLSDWIEDVARSQPLVATLESGHAVSVCCTVRRGSHAHEAGVETVPAFRGRGYAVKVTAGWAHEVRRAGLTPLYSTSWENAASRAVATKLGLKQYCADLHFT
jgi:RimJ/RimL family protein N-acetyltransferase